MIDSQLWLFIGLNYRFSEESNKKCKSVVSKNSNSDHPLCDIMKKFCHKCLLIARCQDVTVFAIVCMYSCTSVSQLAKYLRSHWTNFNNETHRKQFLDVQLQLICWKSWPPSWWLPQQVHINQHKNADSLFFFCTCWVQKWHGRVMHDSYAKRDILQRCIRLCIMLLSVLEQNGFNSH